MTTCAAGFAPPWAAPADVRAVERDITLAHAAAVAALLKREDVSPDAVSVIGFHGHTIAHRPHEGLTWQIGDGARLADCTGIDVVCDLRGRDIAAGGQGAPLAPLYHAALANGIERPLGVLNLGGIGNVTFLGAGDAISAFDTGPGCALIDDWVRRHHGGNYDADGALAAAGTVGREAPGKIARPSPFSTNRRPNPSTATILPVPSGT